MAEVPSEPGKQFKSSCLSTSSTSDKEKDIMLQTAKDIKVARFTAVNILSKYSAKSFEVPFLEVDTLSFRCTNITPKALNIPFYTALY